MEENYSYESLPQSSLADAAYERDVTLPRASRTSFQSEPSLSTADVHHGEMLTRSKRLSLVGIAVDDRFSQVQGFAGQCCAICFEDNDCDVIELDCGGCHRFHRHCIKPWLEASASMASFVCPMCRRRPQAAISSCEVRLDGVFESTPNVTEAHASGRSGLPPEPVIGSVQSGTFENNPMSSVAHASAASTLEPTTPHVRTPRRSGVFENTPMPSPAHVPARLPSETISQSARSLSVGGTFENNGTCSSPHASEAAPVVCTTECSQIACQNGLFVNIPTNNGASVSVVSSVESSFGCPTLPRRRDMHASSESVLANFDPRQRCPRRRLRSPSSWISAVAEVSDCQRDTFNEQRVQQLEAQNS